MDKKKRAERREKRVRGKIRGTSSMLRLSVYRSNRFIYAQIINDEKGVTLVGVSEKHLVNGKGTKVDRARLLGKHLAEKAQKKKIKKVVFDRGKYVYKGRIRAVAEGAREGGLHF